MVRSGFREYEEEKLRFPACCRQKNGGLYFAKTDSDKSENLYRDVVNRTLPNQESAKPESAKTHSGIC